jgi:cytochrome c oxidase cbb3-type subunit I/II
MIRPFKDEYLRYGMYSKPGEFVYDHPFQWGSRRIGPDLQKIGGKYSNLWHYRHMQNPRSISENSIMPGYSWLLTEKMDTKNIKSKLEVMRKLGVPYSLEDIANGEASLKAQAEQIARSLKEEGQIEDVTDKEIVSVIAYLQRLGQDVKK